MPEDERWGHEPPGNQSATLPSSEAVLPDDALDEAPPLLDGGYQPMPEFWGAERPGNALHEIARRRVVLAIVAIPLLGVLALKVVTLLQVDRLLLIYGVLVTATIAFALFRRIHSYRDPGMNRTTTPRWLPRVSVLVAAFNEEHHIERCLRSIVASDYRRLEVIAVDDASTDRTGEMLERLRRELGLQVITLNENRGKKAALAEATRIATGEIIVHTDSDSMLAHDAVSRLVVAFASGPDIGAVAGHTRVLNPRASLLARLQDGWYETQFSVWKAAESSYGAVSCVSGPLAAFRREAIFNYMPAWVDDRFMGAPFRFATDRQLTGYVLGGGAIGPGVKRRYADDWFVASEPHRDRSWKVVYSRAAQVWTDVPARFTSLVRQQIRWKKSFIRNLFFTGAFYWRRPVGASALFYAGALFTLFGPIVATRQLILLPSQGHIASGVVYLSGILLVGVVFALFMKAENPESRNWFLRPLMGLLSTVLLTWLLLYSLVTIKKMTWVRGGTR